VTSKRYGDLRVLHVGPGWGQRGGIASVLAELELLSCEFRANGVLVKVFETHGFTRLATKLAFLLRDIPRFMYCLLCGVDVVHFHVSVKGSFYRKFFLFLLARLMRRRTVFHLHAGNFDAFFRLAGRATQFAVRRFVNGATAVAVSHEIANVIRSIRTNGNPVYVIGNTARLCEQSIAASGVSSRPRGAVPSVAFAGRLTPAKGIAELLHAVAHLKVEGCVVHVELAGSGDEPFWKCMASELGIESQVSFAGWLEGDAKLDFYRRACIFCMPSHYEAFGISTLEAMYCELPVVGTRVGGFPDLVEEGLTGYLVETGDVKALAAKLRLLAESPELAVAMGRAGLERARQCFSSDAVVDLYVTCYRNEAEK
jgi:glycosyltransferase involved in cell wall biosynthesis